MIARQPLNEALTFDGSFARHASGPLVQLLYGSGGNGLDLGCEFAAHLAETTVEQALEGDSGDELKPVGEKLGKVGGAFGAPSSRGFPNPWLWPTDAAVGGCSGSPLLQGLLSEAPSHPVDQPMKIPVFPEDGLKEDSCEEAGSTFDDQATSKTPSTEENYWPDFGECRWHKSAETVGVISSDGHIFTKSAGPRRSRVSDRGARVELASICMVFDSSLRCGGVHRYNYQIINGELGAADGAGFVFDSKVRRNNIQRMRSVFLNQRGRICLRNNQQVTKLAAQLPPLTVGVRLALVVDLDLLVARFNIINPQGYLSGSADVSLEGLLDHGLGTSQLRSGFFCAVVTGDITIGIH